MNPSEAAPIGSAGLGLLGSTGSPWLVIPAAVLAGFGAGMLSALLGIGGAVVTTPVVRLLGGAPIEAVGSTVPAIVPGAISGAWRYAREGMVEWRVALTLGGTGAVTAVAGALVSDVVNGRILMVMTAGVMLWAGASVIVKLRRSGGAAMDTAPDPDEARARSSWMLVAVLGAVAGFVAGLLGVGGGIILVPVLTGPLRLPMRRAVASSLVAVATFQLPALFTHMYLGHVNWALALPLMVGVIPGAQVGAHLTVAATDRTIRMLFGLLIVVLAVIYGLTEVRGLLVSG
ncbi:MAG: sulfite exporter TauE/SafE family protein [Microthrixaceae bacterium]